MLDIPIGFLEAPNLFIDPTSIYPDHSGVIWVWVEQYVELGGGECILILLLGNFNGHATIGIGCCEGIWHYIPIIEFGKKIKYHIIE